MKFFSVNQFVAATSKIVPKIEKINIVFNVKETKEDKFGKYNALPLLIFIFKSEGEKEIWTYSDIISKYEEEISITVPKPEKSKNGYCNIQINTEPVYMEKYQTSYYKRFYSGLTLKVIEKAEESLQQKQESEKTEDLDL